LSLRKGLIIFIVLAFGGNAIILIRSVDRQTIHTLLHADTRYLLLALALILGAWGCDTLRFWSLTKSAQENVSLKLGLILTWLHYFGCAVTPMQSGGGPFQVYVLYRHNVPVGKGIAITMIRTMLTVLLLSLIVPISLLLDPTIIRGNPFLSGVVKYVFAVILLTWIFIGFTIARPNSVKKLGRILIIWLHRLPFLRRIPVLSWSRWISQEMDNYSLNFKLTISSGFRYFIAALVLSGGHLLLLFSILPCLMAALGLPFNFEQALLSQAIFMFVLYFIPTPGASGVAEIGGAALFSTLMPENLAGVVAITWRFFTEYLAIFMGAGGHPHVGLGRHGKPAWQQDRRGMNAPLPSPPRGRLTPHFLKKGRDNGLA
jgi:uncharacterized protein (TIRG00374 family)